MRPCAARQCRGPTARQGGFALVAAIFLIVVLAALGTFAVRVAMAQYQSASEQLLEARAQAAAEAGIEYGSNQALIAARCANRRLSLTQGLAGFVVTVTCSSTQHQVGTPPTTKMVYALTATASYGTYGRPDYVARTVTRNVTNAPP